jgi:hypothetical protein
VGIVGASFDARERGHSVIDNDTNLFTLSRGTGKHCGTRSILLKVGNGEQTHAGIGHSLRMVRVQTREKTCASEYGQWVAAHSLRNL